MRRFEKRHDSAGREIWYRRDSEEGTSTRIARPARFYQGDEVLDLTADAPTFERRWEGEWVTLTRLPLELQQYWITTRLRNAPPGPFQRARDVQLELIRSGRVRNPDRIRVWQIHGDVRRRFTVSSWIRFMTEDRYRGARLRIAERDEEQDAVEPTRYVLGLTDRRGDLGEELEELTPDEREELEEEGRNE